MTFEKTQLPAFLIGDLYKDVLIEEPIPLTLPVSKKGEIQYLGNNGKNILIIVKDKKDEFLSEPDLGFLTGIIGACKLTLKDIAIVNAENVEMLNNKSINKHLQPDKTLLFGIDPSILDLPMQFPHFQVQEFNNQQFLSAPDLSTLASDKELKIQLWNSLKKLFSL